MYQNTVQVKIFTKKSCTFVIMKRIIILFTLLLAGVSALAGNSFKQTKTIKASGKKIVSEGTYSFKAPDQLVMQYTKPDGDFFIIDGPIIRFDMRGTAAELDTSNNPLARAQRNTLLNSLTGNYKDIATDMDASIAEEVKAGVKTVTITANKKAAKGYSKLVLTYKGGTLKNMILEEFNGISTEYVLN